jgi:hypothetical protein
LYFYALSAHFGQWKKCDDAGKQIWQVAAELVYGQINKIIRRRRLMRVAYTMLLGEQENLKIRSAKDWAIWAIDTAFVERLI